ncbi:CATRA system-associated protein [Micromonospora sp. WMMD736]|uniref:CATRA system-associated protein n=1 Tax=Micromonospora sp. WMMD736 TaxID=3404112 RepID=UPI003B93DE4B
MDDVRESQLSPEKWELFGDYVTRMDAALDQHDLAEIQRCRQRIEALETLHDAKAKLGGVPKVPPSKVPQPAAKRQQADRLTERLKKGQDPGATAGRPR